MITRRYIPINTKWETGRIYLDEIIYIEKDLQKINIHTLNRMISIYGKMSDIEQYFDCRFLSCHRSFAFNMDKIVVMSDQTIYLLPNIKIPLGRESFRRGKKIFGQYLEKQKNQEET